MSKGKFGKLVGRLWASVAVSVLLVNGAFAEERVIEEELVLFDPTVAEEKKFLAGGALDYWYVKGPLRGQNQEVVGDIEGFMIGGTVYLGYDDFTLMLSQKKGDFNSTFATQTRDVDREEFDVRLRWMFRDTEILGITPYLLAGYNRTRLEQTSSITVAGRVFDDSGEETLLVDRVYDSGVAGFGGILPFGDSGLGLRADVSALYSSATREIKNPGAGVDPDQSGSGLGGMAHITGYWTIYKGLSIQAGAKGSFLNGGPEVGRYGRVGFFGQLGYTFRFDL